MHEAKTASPGPVVQTLPAVMSETTGSKPRVHKVFARQQGAGTLEAVALVTVRTGVRALAARFERPPDGTDTRWRCTALQLRLTAGDLADEHQDFTMEGIAALAGVGKQTIYRWWPTKGDVLLESLAARAEVHISTTDQGSYAEDLRHFLDLTFELLRPPGVRSALRSLMAESQRNPDLLQRFRSGFLERRRGALSQIVDRAGDRRD